MKRLLFSFLALRSQDHGKGVAAGHDTAPILPRSNATHIVWNDDSPQDPTPTVDGPTFGARRRRRIESDVSLSSSLGYQVQAVEDAQAECMRFLRDNLMTFDLPFQETMGFPIDEDGEEADGLGYGLIGPTIQLALQAKMEYPWTDALPKDIFMEYVLNYANLNEARTNWRPLLVDTLRFNESDLWLSGDANLTSAVTWVNQHLWSRLGRGPDHPIVFKSGQTPLIFDPMSIIAFGYASCTGTSVLFANALRAVGIPARVVGTPAWYGNRTQGNHNWVEVYDIDSNNGAEWKFLEPSPANAGLDTLDKDPCERWFCQASRYPSSRVYAARLLKHTGSEPATYFPLAWEWGNQDVPGVDRTQYYTDICGSCGKEE
jgi:hypothetical protein